MKARKIYLDLNKLPLILEVIINGMRKEYVLKLGKKSGGLSLTKKQDY